MTEVDSNSEYDIKKLSEAIAENDEIVNDVNNFIKDVKVQKTIDEEKYNDLKLNLEDIIDIINHCKQEDDPQLKSFDSKKKAALTKAEKAKKSMDDIVAKTEKQIKSNAEKESKKKSKEEGKENKKKSDATNDNKSLKSVESDGNLSTLDQKDSKKSVKFDDNSKINSENDKLRTNSDEEKDDDIEPLEKQTIAGSQESIFKKKNKDSKKDSKSLNDDNNATNESNKNDSKKDKKETSKKGSKNKDTDISKDETKNGKEIPEVQEQQNSLEHDEPKPEKKERKSFKLGRKDSKKEKETDDKNKKDVKVNEDELKHNDDESGKLSRKGSKKEKLSKIDKKEASKDDSIHLGRDKTDTAEGHDLEEHDESKQNKKGFKFGKKNSKKEKESEGNKNKEKSKEDDAAPVMVPSDKMKAVSVKDEIDEDAKPKVSSNNMEKPGTSRNSTMEFDVGLTTSKSDNSHLQNRHEIPDYPEDELALPYVVTKGFTGEDEDDDLSCTEGEEITVLETNEDGWWYAKKKDGTEGFVPLSCIQPKQNVADVSEKEERSNKQNNEKSNKQKEETSNKEKEMRPRKEMEGTPTYMKSPDIENTKQMIPVNESIQQKGISEVLKEFGPLPSGFRYSTLADWNKQSSVKTNASHYLVPKLSDSHLGFQDLQFDHRENKIRPRQLRIQRILQIVKAIQMSTTSDKFVCKSRHIRICLFNGEKAISNSCVLRAYVTDKDPKTWNFNSKSTKSLDFNELFVRYDGPINTIVVLLEFCMLGFKSKIVPSDGSVPATSGSKAEIEQFTDDDLVEFSCGWTKVPLFDDNAQPINNKNADYELFGGTPFDNGLEVDPEPPKDESSGKSKTPSKPKRPQVSVKLSLPNKEMKTYIETLPNVMIGSSQHLRILSYYRRILASEVLEKRENLTSVDSVYSPFLNGFQEAASSADLLDAMNTVWNDRVKDKSYSKDDYSMQNKQFQDAFNDYIYPITKISNLPKIDIARKDIETARDKKILEIIQQAKESKVKPLLAAGNAFTPLSFNELSFNVVAKTPKTVKCDV